MKTVAVNIEGNSLLAYVTFYDEDILSKLNEIDEGEYDFIEFSSEHKKSSTFLGRGFCEDGNLSLKVSVDGTEVFDDVLFYLDETGCPADDIEQLKEIYGEDEDYENCLIAKSSECLDADSPFLPMLTNTNIARLKQSNATNPPTPSRLKRRMTSSFRI
ncbi:hypothetical protein N9822_00360 [bacterium]|nr:hypothetical protein [bacterium]